MSKTLLLMSVLVAFSATGVMAQQRMMRPNPAMKACKPDIAKFCSQVPPGEGRIKACMKSHVHELSEPCKEALFQAWLHQ